MALSCRSANAPSNSLLCDLIPGRAATGRGARAATGAPRAQPTVRAAHSREAQETRTGAQTGALL